MRKPLIVAYDISKNKSRNRVFKIMKSWRIGGQKSVHECRLDIGQVKELFLQLAEHMNEKTDSLLVVWLEPHRKVLHRGIGNAGVNSRIRHIG